MLTLHKVWRWIALLVSLCALAACGGGGGGNDDDDDDGPSNNGGGFTLSATTATFAAPRFYPPPLGQSIAVTLTDTAAAKLVAGFPTGQTPPSWLDVALSGTAPNLTLTLRVTTTDLALGQHSATVIVATTTAADTVLQSRQLSVTYNLAPGIRATPSLSSAPFVFGSSDTTEALTLNVDPDGLSWTITSDAPWLTVPTGTQQGSRTLPLTIDASALAPGGYSALLTVQDTAGATVPARVIIGANVSLPTLTVTPAPLVLGGSDGLGQFAQTLSMTLDTGTNGYAWSMVLSDSQAAGWLQGSAASGDPISGTNPGSVTLNADLASVQTGQYTGLARFSADVQGRIVTTDVPVTLNRESHRLFVEHNGVGLSSLRLTRSLRVTTTRGRTASWTAQADQPWLTVTPSGTTNTSLQITAEQSALPVNQLSVGAVTLTSNDPGIGPETIRVGFWRLSTNPANVEVALAGNSRALATNPVEPYAYSGIAGSGAISVYNVYTGALVTQFTGLTTSVDALATSPDGRLLFVTDADSRTTYALHAANGSLVATYAQGSGDFSDPMALIYTQPNGHGVLWTPYNQAIDVEARTSLKLTSNGVPLFRTSLPVRRAASPDGLDLFETSTIATDSGIDRYSQRFTVFAERAMDMVEISGTGTGGGQSGRDMCVSGSGSTLATLGNFAHRWSIAPTAVRDPDTLTLPALPAVAVACGWNGRIYVGLDASSSPQNNLYVFSENGENAAPPTVSGPNNSARYFRKLRLSGDARRAVSAVIVSSTTYLTFYAAP
jgi:hypothetical protein